MKWQNMENIERNGHKKYGFAFYLWAFKSVWTCYDFWRDSILIFFEKEMNCQKGS